MRAVASRFSGGPGGDRLPAWGAAEVIAAEGLAAADAVAEAEPPTASTRPALMGGPATGAIPVAGWEAVSGRRDARPAPARTGADVCARLRRERALPRTRLRRGVLWTAIRAFTPRSAPPWEGLERLLRHATAEWERRPRHRDPIFERDGWRCAVPACTARASLQDHHVIYRSHGGDNARDNRVAICAAHHLNGIHRLRIRVSGVAPHDLTWEIGFRRGRPPLLRTHGDRYLDTP